MPKFLYLSIGITCVLFIAMVIQEHVYHDENLVGTIQDCSFISAGIFAFICVIQFTVIPSMIQTKWVETDSITLASLREKTVGEGTFYLGTGSVKGIDYYSYYRKWEGGYKKEKITAQALDKCKTDTIVYEHPNLKTGELKLFKRVFVENWYEYLGASDLIECNKYQFHIPEGSIQKGFVLE